jgi:RNA polymerase sigma-70 factor (ECF subfamily)
MMQAQATAILAERPAVASRGETFSDASRASYDSAFAQAYEQYYTKLFAFIYSRVGNVELTKDLVAEAFEKAYLKGHDVREPAAYVTWLFMIAKNTVIGHYRRSKREMNRTEKVKEDLWLSERPSDPEQDAIHGETVRHLMRELRNLSRRDQELLSLKFEGELSYLEIGKVLGISDVNVRVSIFRALRRLRALMEKAEA